MREDGLGVEDTPSPLKRSGVWFGQWISTHATRR